MPEAPRRGAKVSSGTGTAERSNLRALLLPCDRVGIHFTKDSRVGPGHAAAKTPRPITLAFFDGD